MLEINFDQKIVEEMPVALRKISHFRWLKALITPIVMLYQDLLLNYKEWLILAKYSSQTLVIETIPNQRYALTNGGIYIINSTIEDDRLKYIFTLESGISPEFFAYLAEAQPSNLSDTNYIYDWQTLNQRDYDFRILIPRSLNIILNQELEIKAFIDKVKVVTKKFIIEYY